MSSPSDSPGLNASTVADPVYLWPGVAVAGVPAGGRALQADTQEVAVGATSRAEVFGFDPSAADRLLWIPCHPPVVPSNSLCWSVKRFDGVVLGGGTVVVVVVVSVGGWVDVGDPVVPDGSKGTAAPLVSMSM